MEKHIRERDGYKTHVLILNESDIRRDSQHKDFNELSFVDFFQTEGREEYMRADLVIYNDRFLRTKIFKNRWGNLD
ncbi:MAG TPA: hypothetical protein P5509_06880 [Bacteroidales bacterium]|nr:hypothetical protein [Bacteroidales bacterium]